MLSSPHRGVLLPPTFETICKTQWKKSRDGSVKSSAKFPERSRPARDFGGAAALIARLAEAGKEQFGSGWVWLVSRDGMLAIEKTGNAATPMSDGVNGLLTIDVWEHAYYLDYQNARQNYLQAIISRLIN